MENYNYQVILPVDEGAEANVLGTIMNHQEMFSEVDDILTYDAFHGSRNKALYRILKYIIINNGIVDENAVVACAEHFKDQIGVSVDEVRYGLMEIAVSDGIRTFVQDVDRIVDYGMRRRVWEALQKSAQQIVQLTENPDETINNLLNGVETARNIVKVDSGIIDAKAAIKMVYEQINDNLAGTNSATVKTGYHFTDNKGGARLGTVIVIGAWTSVGKSTIALNMAVNIASVGVPVAYYSMEMGAVELWSRIISSYTSISAGKILNYPLKREEVSHIDQEVMNISELPLYIDDKATTTHRKVMRSVRTLVKKYGIKVFFIDYLQIFAQNSRGQNEESAIGSMVREYKNICRELNIACVVLSQLRRDKEERHPTIDMLRGSGQIEESADVIALLDRPDAHPEWGVRSFAGSNESIVGTCEIRVCKGRNIGLGTYYVGFDASRMMFYEKDGYRIGDDIGYDDGVPRIEHETEPEQTENNMPF